MSTIKWLLDPAHSEITFKVNHLLISNVTGRLNRFNLEVETKKGDFLEVSVIHFTSDVESIDTNNESRDVHLKSEDFFHETKHRKIKFTAKDFLFVGAEATLHGALTIKGITKPISVLVEFGGITTDFSGVVKAGISISGKFNRSEFGLTWSPVTEAGSIVVGDEVKFQGEIQLMKNTKQTLHSPAKSRLESVSK